MLMEEGTNSNYHRSRRLTFGALLNSPDDSQLNSSPTARRDDSSSGIASPNDTTPTPARSSNSSSSPRNSSFYFYSQTPSSSGDVSPTPSYYNSPGYYSLLSPYSHPSPYTKSPWILPTPFTNAGKTGLIGSIVREEGHVYSLAAAGGFLYSGSDSKNIRVWKNMKDFSGFKSGSGLVKAIVIYKDKIFTGHQDGKIRVWRGTATSFSTPPDHVVSYKRAGSLPTFKETIKASVNPKNYVEVRRKKTALRIKHYDAVSCMSLNEELGLLYSGSWDKTVKVWRVKKEYKFLESIPAHDDAVNSVVSGFDSLVFTGSADGTVKVWRRELVGRATRHVEVQTLLKQDHAVTSLAVDKDAGVVYCGASDGVVNFWERDSWHLTHGGALLAHKMAVLCLASAQGGLVVSGSADRSVCVWRRELDGSHSWVTALTGHGGPVKCLAVDEEEAEEEGQRRWTVYSGSLDRSVRVWRVSGDAPESPPRVSPFSSPAQDNGKELIR